MMFIFTCKINKKVQVIEMCLFVVLHSLDNSSEKEICLFNF